MNIWRIVFWNHSTISAFNFITTFVNNPSSWAQYFQNTKRMNYVIAKSTRFYSICHRQSVKKRLSAFLKYKMADYFSVTPLIVFNATLSNVSFVLPKGR